MRLLLLLVELAALPVLLNQPGLAARRIEVTGLRHLSRQQVLDLAGFGDAGSIFLVTPDRAESELRGDPYVRSVSVRATLPDRVVIDLVEWEPLAVVTRAGDRYLLNPEGSVLGRAGAISTGRGGGQPHVAVTMESGGPLRVGEKAVSGRLLDDLVRMQAIFSQAYRLTVSRFVLLADQQLVVETAGGPRILFGQMVTEEQIDSLEAKLGALKSLSQKVDLAHSKLDYVNLMNPGAPVTHAIPSPSPSANPSPSPKVH